MSRPAPRHTPAWLSRRAVTNGLVAVLGLSLTGCGLPDRVVGLHDAPGEKTSGAAYAEAAALSIVTRVLTAADAAFASSDAARKTRRTVLTGPALRSAEVENRFEDRSASLRTRGKPTVLGISAGRDWPRHILATTLVDGVQELHVLRANSPTSPYKLLITAPMLPGASLPTLPPLAEGITVVAGDKGLAASPTEVLTAYGQLLNVPTKTKTSKIVTTKDAYAAAVAQATAAQQKALGTLGTFTRTNKPATETLSFRLADGGALVFGQLARTDQLAPTSKAKRLDLPANLAKLAKTKSVTESLRLNWLMSAIAVVPTSGAATVIGVGEQLRGIEAD